MKISKLGILCRLFTFFLLPGCSIFAENLSTVGNNYPGIKQSISSLKEKSDKIHSLQMDYTLLTENESLPTVEDININFSFIMSGNNYILSYTRPAKEVISDNPKKKDNIINIDEPKNPLESWLINRYKMKRKNKEEKPLSYFDLYTEYIYFYNNKYNIYSVFSKGEEKHIMTREFLEDLEIPPIFVFEDPRIFIGKGGIMDPQIKTRKDRTLSLIEFLEKDGPYYYKEEKEYRTIWHMSRLENNFPLEIEFHIDPQNNLIKVKEVMRPFWRFENNEIREIEEVLGKKVTCEYPEKIISETIFSDFYSEWGIPLKMEKFTYDYSPQENKKSEWETVYKKYEEGKLSYAKFIGYYYLFNSEPKIKKRAIILVHKESLKINEPIDESTFVSPVKTPEEISNKTEENKRQSQISWYRRYTGVILVGGCVAFTLLLMFLTRRYLGWGA